MKKTKTKNANLIITHRDMEIFLSLAKYHLTGTMVFKISKTFKEPFKSLSNTRARLGQLYGTGFLRKAKRVMENAHSNESYYFLTKKSADCVPELEGVEKKNAVFQPRSIGRQAHSFLISEIMVKLERDRHFMRDICSFLGFIRENYFEVKGNNRLIKPDGTIFLSVNGYNHLLFLEADRSTEVVKSSKANKRTFQRKIEIYSEFKKNFWQDGFIHQNFADIRGYRVLIVCRSEQRLQNLLTLAEAMNKGSMFWFATKDQLLDENKNCLFDRIWALPNSPEDQLYALF